MAFVAVAVVALLLVGLPVLAVRWSRRPVWSAPTRPSSAEAVYVVARRHGLDAGETDRVARAVRQGEALDDLRLRAAAAETAELVLAGFRTSRRSLRRRVLAGVAAVLVIGVIVGDGIGRGDLFTAVWWPLYFVGLVLFQVRSRKRIHAGALRAVELNRQGAG